MITLKVRLPFQTRHNGRHLEIGLHSVTALVDFVVRQGHAHPLVGCQSVANSPELITADVSGMIRLWDIRTFQCVQSMVRHDLNPVR